jgi:hypothetical protein
MQRHIEAAESALSEIERKAHAVSNINVWSEIDTLRAALKAILDRCVGDTDVAASDSAPVDSPDAPEGADEPALPTTADDSPVTPAPQFLEEPPAFPDPNAPQAQGAQWMESRPSEPDPDQGKEKKNGRPVQQGA